MAGHDPWTRDWKDDIGNRYGIIFEIPGEKLEDIQPDEDAVGEILKSTIDWFNQHKKPIYDFKWPTDMTEMKWLYHFAKSHLTMGQWMKVVRHADEFHLYDAGKKLVSKMEDWQKLKLIDMGASIANESETIVPVKGWLIDKMESMKYKKDGSNFFQVAKPINIIDLEKLKSLI